MTQLEIYVSQECWTCEESRNIADEMRALFPQMDINLVELNGTEARPEHVFATPTYVLDGNVIFLGNPTRLELERRLTAASGSPSANGESHR